MLTSKDVENATKYANYYTNSFKINYYKLAYPVIFGNVIQNVKVDKDGTRTLKLKFEMGGCMTVGCVPYKQDGSSCVQGEDPTFLLSQNTKIPTCLPICHFPTDGNYWPLDTIFTEGKCVLDNTVLKQYAMVPRIRYDDPTNVPSNLVAFDYEYGRMFVNQDYCRRFGVHYDSSERDCYIPKDQLNAEKVFGSHFIRMLVSDPIKVRQYAMPSFEPVLKDPIMPKFVPDEAMEDVLTRLEMPTPKRTTRSQENPVDLILTALDDDLLLRIAVEIGFDMSIHQIKIVIKKKLAGFVTNRAVDVVKHLSTKYGSKVLSQATTLMVRQVVFTASSAVSTTLVTILNPVTLVLTLITVIGLIASAVDLGNVNHLMYKKDLDRISSRYMLKFREVMNIPNGGYLEVTPEIAWTVMEKYQPFPFQEEYFYLGLVKMSEYLDSLKVNYYGQNIRKDEPVGKSQLQPQQTLKDTPPLQWIFTLVISLSLMIFGLVYVKLIEYVLVVFLILGLFVI